MSTLPTTGPSFSELSREHEEFRRAVRDFATAEIAPHAAAWDRAPLPVDVVQRMGSWALRSHGTGGVRGAGEDGDFTSPCVAIEEIGRVDQSLGITLEVAVGLGINPILTYGTDEQRKTRLPDLVAGRRLAGFGLTEPGAARTRARPAPARCSRTASGSSTAPGSSSPTWPDVTSLVTVTARTGEREGGKAEISTIIVPSGTPGFTVEKAYDKLGWHASDTHPLTFEDVRVPEANLLGARARVRAVPRHPRRRPRGDRGPGGGASRPAWR